MRLSAVAAFFAFLSAGVFASLAGAADVKLLRESSDPIPPGYTLTVETFVRVGTSLEWRASGSWDYCWGTDYEAGCATGSALVSSERPFETMPGAILYTIAGVGFEPVNLEVGEIKFVREQLTSFMDVEGRSGPLNSSKTVSEENKKLGDVFEVIFPERVGNSPATKMRVWLWKNEDKRSSKSPATR